jgi:hypothetical protein
VSPKRDAELTICNLTDSRPGLRSVMRVITIQRTVRKADPPQESTNGRSISEFARKFFASENHLEFALEALVFAVLLAVSAWPIIAAAGPIKDLL